MEIKMAVKYVFVTGGVVSGLGKGITAASLGRLLKMRGYKVTMQKFDPYINIDPGTMNPIQHGEVFVTDDGAETDLDLGHYERFIDESLTKNSNVTTGKVYWSVLQKERRGDYGGGTVQVIPHITNEIKSRFYRNFTSDETHIAIIEVGGTVGDIESQPFKLQKSDVKKLLQNSGIKEEKLENFEQVYEETAGEDAFFQAANLVEAKSVAVKTPDVTIKVSPQRMDLVQIQLVEGRRCIVIPMEDGVQINGMNVTMEGTNGTD